MKEINILDELTINKIAAGEVIEKPSSIVKELVENSIDAGAKNISVEIKNGGISFLRITDNGEGIKRNQIKKAFTAHATSKIKNAEDLFKISSLGFRGEALASIAAVAKVELLTKCEDDVFGSRYLIEGSKEMCLEDVGVPCGTTIIVRDLFFNTPARLKFLKSPVTEGGYIVELMEHFMLCNPSVSFKLTVNDKLKLQSYGNGNVKDVIYSIYGRDVASSIIPVEYNLESMCLKGFIGKPELSRSNRNFEVYFVNGRYIKTSIVSKALDEGYKNFMMLHKYPTVFLYLTLDPSLIDVNVHPSKLEIRFSENDKVYKFISESINDALSLNELIYKNAFSEDRTNPVKPKTIDFEKALPEPFEVKNNIVSKNDISYSQEKTAYSAEDKDIIVNNSKNGVNNTGLKTNISYDTNNSLKDNQFDENTFISNEIISENRESVTVTDSNHKILSEEPEKNEQLSLFSDDFLSEKALKRHRIIGQVFGTYWMVEYDEKLYVIDQHAAHEKVMYERFIKQISFENPPTQNLNPPEIISLSLSEEETFNKYKTNFEELGFNVEPFGGREYAIYAVPLELHKQSPKEYFKEVLDELYLGKFNTKTDSVNLRIATMACKAAVKGNTTLSLIEAEKLIDELLNLENPYNCPHGRPTIASITKNDIEKMFKRIVV